MADALCVLEGLPDVGAVVHGDCSRGNMLSGEGGWWLVDPRGVVGDWHYDVAVAGWKCRYGGGELEVLCRAAGADPRRVAAWRFVAEAAQV